MAESGLPSRYSQLLRGECEFGRLTSTAIPGTNMATVSPWKNFRRAFNPRVGICLSAASSRSVATVAGLTPFMTAVNDDCAATVGVSVWNSEPDAFPSRATGTGPDTLVVDPLPPKLARAAWLEAI